MHVPDDKRDEGDISMDLCARRVSGTAAVGHGADNGIAKKAGTATKKNKNRMG